MARDYRWGDRERRHRDDDNLDWRSAGEDWRREEQYYRSGPRGYQGGTGMYGSDRDYGADESRRRDFAGYGGEPTGDEGFARSEADRYGRYAPPYGGRSRDDPGASWRARDYERGRSGGRSSVYHGDERGLWDRASDEVASWFGDRDAERRRRDDEFRGRGPKGYVRSEDRIREDVNDQLTDDPFIDASEIEVSVSGNEVTLSGTVASREQRRFAEDCAERVSGVSYVQNNIRVKWPTTDRPSIGQTAFGRDTSGGAKTGGAKGTTDRTKGV